MKNCLKSEDYLIKITNDCFDVAATLSALDGYEVFYNATKKRYQIHKGNRIELILPYDCLDCRTIELVRKTAKQNADALFAEIEAHNAKIEGEKRKQKQNLIEEKIRRSQEKCN